MPSGARNRYWTAGRTCGSVSKALGPVPSPGAVKMRTSGAAIYCSMHYQYILQGIHMVMETAPIEEKAADLCKRNTQPEADAAPYATAWSEQNGTERTLVVFFNSLFKTLLSHQQHRLAFAVRGRLNPERPLYAITCRLRSGRNPRSKRPSVWNAPGCTSNRPSPAAKSLIDAVLAMHIAKTAG